MKQRLDTRVALNRMRQFLKDYDRLPSLGELARLCGYASRNAAVYLVNRLIAGGYLKKDLNGHLLTTAIFHQRVRLLGSVAAGFPTPEEEELRQSVDLDTFMIDNPQATYMLEVKGDSMIQAGICPGDYVLVEKGRNPKLGDIVIAQVDGEWTMKYYRKKEGRVYLEAANTKYADIFPAKELFFGGVVVSSCRKYV